MLHSPAKARARIFEAILLPSCCSLLSTESGGGASRPPIPAERAAHTRAPAARASACEIHRDHCRLGSTLSTHLRHVLTLLDDSLSLNGQSASFDRDTPLLGALPELDSMAVATLLTAIEETFGIAIGDDEIDGSVFATVGSLADFIEQKLA